jgi:hypothetical protein
MPLDMRRVLLEAAFLHVLSRHDPTDVLYIVREAGRCISWGDCVSILRELQAGDWQSPSVQALQGLACAPFRGG